MSEDSKTKPENDDKVEIVPTVKTDDLPPITPPQTKTPINFNQQINYQQIPPSAWDGLTPDQRIELSKNILEKMDAIDDRHYKFALKHIDIETKRGMIRAVCGTLIALFGFGISAYLATHNQTFSGLAISLPLATIIAVVVGNRVIGRF
jgi:hypothetical protein